MHLTLELKPDQRGLSKDGTLENKSADKQTVSSNMNDCLVSQSMVFDQVNAFSFVVIQWD